MLILFPANCGPDRGGQSPNGDCGCVFRLSLDTGERRQLTLPPRGITGDRQCVFSPDGRYLAIVRYQNDTSSDLYVTSLDGGEPRRLTHDRIYHSGLTWTPDSRALIYGAQRQSQTWVFGVWRCLPSEQRSRFVLPVFKKTPRGRRFRWLREAKPFVSLTRKAG
jgi:Tol biopolymer transport system component